MKNILITFVLIAFFAVSTATAQSSNNDKLQQELLKLIRDAVDATVKGEKTALERLLSEDYIETDATIIITASSSHCSRTAKLLPPEARRAQQTARQSCGISAIP